MMRMHCFFCLLMGLSLAAEARAEADAARIVAERRAKGQFREADEYALEQWRRADLSDRERAELATQRALVCTEWALAAPPDRQAALWAKADSACAEFLQGWPHNPRRKLVEIQRGLVSLARGQQARELRQTEQAKEHLRVASRRLDEVADAIERELIELRLRSHADSPPDALTAPELESVKGNLSYHTARCQRQLGLCYPPNSADRDDALLQAVQRLTPLARRTPADDLVWNARIELAGALRELGRGDSARQLVISWLAENPPESLAVRLTAEAEATSLAPETDLAVAPAANGGEASGEDSDALMRAATMARQAGRYAEAGELYRRSALGRPDRAEAAEVHRRAILCMADALREAPPAQQSAFAPTYLSFLQEHLVHWPAEGPSDEVRLWLGQLMAARGEWASAIEVLQQVRPQAAVFADRLTWLVRCYEALLRDADQGTDGTSDERRAKLLAAATHYLQPLITGAENRWPDPWSEPQRETAWQLARLHLRFSDEPSPYAERLLTAAIHGRSEPSDGSGDSSWEGKSRLLLVEALVRGGKWAEAQALADRLPEPPPALLLEALTAIDDVVLHDHLSADGSEQRAVGELLLKLVRRAEERREELDPESLARFDALRASALAAAGDRDAALAHYAALAAQHPDDGEIQERYAKVLATSQSVAELRQSLECWQRVESRSRRGAARWRRARAARIELLSRLGDDEEAEKLLRLTRLLYPNWDSDAGGGK